MIQGRWKNLDYIPASTAIYLLLSYVNKKDLCAPKSVLPKLITLITTAGSIFGVYASFPPGRT